MFATTTLQKKIAKLVTSLSRYTDTLFQYNPLKEDDRSLFSLIPHKKKEILTDDTVISSVSNVVYINSNFNISTDIQRELTRLHAALNRQSRVVIIQYSRLYTLFTRISGQASERASVSWREKDLKTLASLSGYQVLERQRTSSLPFLNRFIGASIYFLRPIKPERSTPSMSIIIPARNEEGNIETIIRSLPLIPNVKLEIIFVEGNSSDNTWKEIQTVQRKYEHRFAIKSFQQTGKGKKDAVVLGFQKAKNDLLTILDADMTVPPKYLPDFYAAYTQGHGDFINGNRLMYPMEDDAMRPMNKIGNIFFAKLLSFILTTRLDDALCGTKLFSRADWQRFQAWNKDFGGLDPFGDFDLLFPAGQLQLGVVNVPIPYKARRYGTTNISRFSDGYALLRYALRGLYFFRLKRF